MKDPGMTDRQLDKALREYSRLDYAHKEIGRIRDESKERIVGEFKKRDIDEYQGNNIGGKVKSDPTYDYPLETVLEDFSLSQLYEMGGLKLDLSNFKARSGMKPKEITKKYRKKVGEKAPQLTVTPKPKVAKGFIRKISEAIGIYPVGE